MTENRFPQKSRGLCEGATVTRKRSLTTTVQLMLLALICGLVWGTRGLGEAYEPMPVQNGGVITGLVKFVGPVPSPKQIKVTRDQKICGTRPRPSEALIVSADGGIKNVVVSIENISKGKPQPALEENPKFVQERCWFSPHVLLIPAGSTIDVLNHDKVMHNIRTVSKINPIINKAHPSFKKRLRFKLSKPELIKVNCDIHSWMGAWFVVTAHPYYALTDANGSFTLTDVPSGSYNLKVWHETLGQKSLQVRVKSGEESQLAFELAKP